MRAGGCLDRIAAWLAAYLFGCYAAETVGWLIGLTGIYAPPAIPQDTVNCLLFILAPIMVPLGYAGALLFYVLSLVWPECRPDFAYLLSGLIALAVSIVLARAAAGVLLRGRLAGQTVRPAVVLLLAAAAVGLSVCIVLLELQPELRGVMLGCVMFLMPLAAVRCRRGPHGGGVAGRSGGEVEG